MNELYARPGYLIRRAHQKATALFTEECAGLDLTPVQYAALFAIGENPEIDATRLSELTALDRSTLGQVLERVEAKGWVLRSPSASDRRVKLLRLSATGQRVLKRVEPAVARAQKRLLGPLSAANQIKIMRLLTQLADGE